MVIGADTDDANYVIRKFNNVNKKWGLSMSFKKSEYLVIGTESKNLNIEMKVIEDCKVLSMFS